MAKSGKVDNAILKRLKRKEARRSMAIRNIRQYMLIVCEGERTEPMYFESFKKELPPGVLDNNRIEIEGTGYNTESIIRETIRIRDSKEKSMNRKFDQTWVVFDRDSFPANHFNNAIQMAQSCDPVINCAWSNEAFELWYCLHFCYITHGMPRKDYSKMIGKEIAARSGAPFKYTKNNPELYDLLLKHGNQEQAVKWAQKIAAGYGPNLKYADQNPRTQVWELVNAIHALKD